MILGVRTIELLGFMVITSGFIWASSDWLLVTVLVQAPVTPLSVLMMLYGLMDIGICEGAVRIINKRFKVNGEKKE